MSRLTLLIAALFGLCLAGPASAAVIPFYAALDPASEVPPKSGAGKGDARATLDTATKQLSYTVIFEGLSGPATAAHFHGPAAKDANAGVVVPFTAPVTSPYHGTATLTDDQIRDLEAGKWYVNVHTAANPGGEIRGQMVRAQQ
jgi:hypothetical protein